MMEYSIGERIKDLRGHIKMSQKELCDGICTQGLISRIEGNTAVPTAPLLHQLAVKLGVDVNYFFDDISRHGLNYVKETVNHMDRLIQTHQYAEVMAMIQLEKKNPLFRKRHLRQYLLWREGICVFHMKQDTEEALRLLDEALKLRISSQKNFTEMEVDILTSKAIVYSKAGLLHKASEIYHHLLSRAEALPVKINSRLIIRLYFNASRNEYGRQNFRESVSFADRGIKKCLSEEQLYLLGHMYYQKGSSLFQLDPKRKEECLSYLNQALLLYELNPVPEFIASVKEEMTQISES